MVITLLRITLLTGLCFIQAACGPDLSPSYGRVTVKVSDNAEVFFKREVRGLNYDALVISPTAIICDMPDTKSDYVFSGMGPFDVYYKIENGTLVIFTYYAATPPANSRFPVRVVQNELGSSEFDELEKNAAAQGLQHLEVPIDENLRCSH